MPIGSSFGDIESAFASTVPGAAVEFQRTFPDQSGFRVALVDQCLHLRNTFPDTAKIIDQGLSFLVMALAMAHPLFVTHISGGHLEQLEPMRWETKCELIETASYHAYLCISVLLERTLMRLLVSIQGYLNKPRREDWVPVSLAICLLLMGAESLQVDIYLHGEEAAPGETARAIAAMEGHAVKRLVGLFWGSTGGLNPLAIDWQRQRWDLANPDMVYALQDLQGFSREFCVFLWERRAIEFSEEDTDCLTGRLASHILLIPEESSVDEREATSHEDAAGQ